MPGSLGNFALWGIGRSHARRTHFPWPGPNNRIRTYVRARVGALLVSPSWLHASRQCTVYARLSIVHSFRQSFLFFRPPLSVFLRGRPDSSIKPINPRQPMAVRCCLGPVHRPQCFPFAPIVLFPRCLSPCISRPSSLLFAGSAPSRPIYSTTWLANQRQSSSTKRRRCRRGQRRPFFVPTEF